MKSKRQKEMRRIRMQLKVHNITEEKKKQLRAELDRLRLEEKRKAQGACT